MQLGQNQFAEKGRDLNQAGRSQTYRNKPHSWSLSRWTTFEMGEMELWNGLDHRTDRRSFFTKYLRNLLHLNPKYIWMVSILEWWFMPFDTSSCVCVCELCNVSAPPRFNDYLGLEWRLWRRSGSLQIRQHNGGSSQQTKQQSGSSGWWRVGKEKKTDFWVLTSQQSH